MKIRIMCLFWILVYPAFARVITYPAPKCNLLSNEYVLKIREAGGQWQPADVYHGNVAEVVNTKMLPRKTSFAYFDCSGNVEVSVYVTTKKINFARIRPFSLGIEPVIKGNTITFSIGTNQNVSLEIDGDIFQNLQIFANAIERDRPSVKDTNVIYYGPGVHHIGRVRLGSDKTVYLAGGAIVDGGFTLYHAKNVRILGRGILTQLETGSSATKAMKNTNQKTGRPDAVTIAYSEDVEVSGLVMLSRKYSVLIGQSARIKVSDIKSFSCEGNADGIDIFSSTDVLLDHVFMRNSDDCIAIYGHRWNYYGNAQNINIKNSTLWADVAHPILIGTHGDSQHPDSLSQIKFSNMDILNQRENQMDYQGCMALNAGDSNLIDGVVFDNIRVDEIRKGQLFNIRVMFNKKYNTSAGSGIRNILFKDIAYRGQNAPLSIIAGYDDQRKISNVMFDNLRINDKVITDTMEGKPSFYKTGDMANIFIGEHVENIKFSGTR